MERRGIAGNDLMLYIQYSYLHTIDALAPTNIEVVQERAKSFQ